MELTMTNGFGFCELNENEMMMVDGGWDGAMWAKGVFQVVAGGAILAGTAICAVTTGYVYEPGLAFGTGVGYSGVSNIENSFYR